MNRTAFLDLLDRYQQGHCSENEKIFVEQWYDALDEQDQVKLSASDLSNMSERVSDRLFMSIPKTQIPTPHRIKWYKMGIAASVGIVLACTALYAYTYNNAEAAFKRENSESTLICKTNTSHKILRVALNDQTVVSLQPNAKIIFPATFSKNKRMVYLQGDAFFSVAKNAKKPFYVFNNKLKVKVLGTSFFVRTETGQVAVSTGKVEVMENTCRNLFHFLKKKKVNPVLLTPNQKAVFDEQHEKIDKALVDHPLPLATLNHTPSAVNLKFSETSLAEIFELLSKVYGITINLKDPETSKCAFTGDINNKGLYEQLDLICQSISASYTVKGTEISITANNCN